MIGLSLPQDRFIWQFVNGGWWPTHIYPRSFFGSSFPRSIVRFFFSSVSLQSKQTEINNKQRENNSPGQMSHVWFYLVSWCFEPSQPQKITSGLNTNFALSPAYSFHKSSYHMSCFLSTFIFRGHSTREPAFNRVTYFILRAYIGTGVSHSQRRKKSGDVVEKMQVNRL